MSRQPFQIGRQYCLVLAMALMALMTASPVVQAQSSDIKQTMNEMKRAFNGAMNSSSIEEFSRYAAQLQTSVSAASTMHYTDDPATYRQGMQELQQNLDRMNQAVRAKDLPAAKNALRQMNLVKKHYHDLIG
jgi:soluble cytochrome b562